MVPTCRTHSNGRGPIPRGLSWTSSSLVEVLVRECLLFPGKSKNRAQVLVQTFDRFEFTGAVEEDFIAYDGRDYECQPGLFY